MNNEKIKERIVKTQEQLKTMLKNRKILTGVIAGAVVIFALMGTLYLNSSNSAYTALYSNIDASEASQIYSVLKNMGAEPKLSPQGEVMVPSDEVDVWLLQLAAEGYPKTAPSYDWFSTNTGMTATESERQQWILYQLQDDIRLTLKSIHGVSDATVILNLAESTGYVWDEATNEALGSASVLLTLDNGTALSSDQVRAIKNLVASSVPKMTPEVVTVVDSRTSLELGGENSSDTISTTQNLQFEQMVQKQIEDNIVRLLTTRYETGGVVATAKVTINYDKMITEQLQLQEKEEGGGFPTSTTIEGSVGGNPGVGGIVGEGDNTDIPVYPYGDLDDEDTTYYRASTDIDYSYIKTQIEKGQAELERATVAVMVDEENLTQARRDELVNLVSKSADIAPELIFVSAFNAPIEDDIINPEETVTDNIFSQIPMWVYLVVAGVILLIILPIILIIVMKKRKIKAKKRELERLAKQQKDAQSEEIAAHKKHLTDAAKSGENTKNEAIVEEIRDFAKVNPEITANLIRSWLKGGE